MGSAPAMTLICPDKAGKTFSLSSVNMDHPNKQRANSPYCMFSQGWGSGVEQVEQGLIPIC